MPRQPASINFAAAATAYGQKAGPAATVAAFLLVCAFVLAGCAWPRSGRWRGRLAWLRWRRRCSEADISIQQVQAAAGTGCGGETCLWQRGILMGERCQLPVFSGAIAYDTAGNLVVPGRPCFAKNSAKAQRQQGATS